MTTPLPRTHPHRRRPGFLWLDLTRNCPLACRHCYNHSGPTGTAGVMTLPVWQRVITEAATLGVAKVELIGGEPTRHPDWPVILEHALDHGMDATVYSNLIHIRASWWPILQRPGVGLATSYYSDLPAEHDHITGRRGSHARTRANITQAIQRGIPIRVGMTAVLAGQRIEQGRADLIGLGVPEAEIRVDRTRRVGRAAEVVPGVVPLAVSELCGLCGDGRAAVMPDGRVAPCVVSGDLATGSVLDGSLGEVFDGPGWAAAVARVPVPAPASGVGVAPCSPEDGCVGGCNPTDQSSRGGGGGGAIIRASNTLTSRTPTPGATPT